MIPRVVHRIWLDDPMPDPVTAAGGQIRKLHPVWTLYDWIDRDSLPELANRSLVDQAREWCPRDWRRFEADVLRLELLWCYGGVYLDTDVIMHRPLDELVTGRSCVVGRSPQHTAGHHPVTNCVMAAERHHPWIGRLIETLPRSVRRHQGRPLAVMAGPWHLTRVLEGEGPWSSVTVLDQEDMFAGGLLTHGWNSGKRRRGVATW